MDAFIARQPIFDRDLAVQAYELLFRSGFQNACPPSDPDQASARVITGSQLLPRLDAIAGGKSLFINMTRDLIVQDAFTLLPPPTTVIEVLETVKADAQVLAACRRIKRMGYRLALDDFQPTPETAPLVELADIVKVDVLASDAAERSRLARDLRAKGITVLAEKVETREVFRETEKLGYSLFQGYFFSRPEIVTGRDIPASKRSYLKILREIHQPDLDYRAICTVVEREVALSYKLLRYINSAAFGWRGAVTSIHHALQLLGEREIKRWASVIALAGIASDEPEELVTMALLRGRFCELLAPPADLNQRVSDLFLLGLFSVIDALLQCPLAEILEDLPIVEDVKSALLGEPGTLHDVIDLVVAYTRGEWRSVERDAGRLGIKEDDLPGLYESALAWCEVSQGVTGLSLAA